MTPDKDAERVEPALTPEEWAAGGFDDRSCTLSHGYTERAWLEGRGLHIDGGIGESWMGKEKRATLIAQGRDRHALAALALHGQPFGFTRADVQMLRRLYEGDSSLDEGSAEFDEWCRSLAARVAALLPPKKQEP